MLIVNDIISQIDKNISKSNDCKIIDASGKILIPGLIDDQVHFREPGLTHKATINSESKAAVAGGITSFIEMPNTIPQTTTINELNKKFEIAHKSSYANYSFMFGATNSNLDEIKKINKNEVAALKIFLGSSTGDMLVDNQQILRDIFLSTDLIIVVHSEDEQIINENLKKYKIKYNSNIPFDCHSKIRSEEACLKSTKKIIKLAKETNARLHVFHLSTKLESLLFQNDIPLKEKKITSEVCVHHLRFNENDYIDLGNQIKCNPSIKREEDRAAVMAALLNDQIDIIATDHAPHTLEEKSNTYFNAPSGGPLVQHALPAMLAFVNQGKISIEKVVEKMCHNPAIIFKIEKRGYIKKGFYADLVLVDIASPWTVKKDNILYKCGWSPFEGVTFNHEVSRTFVNGRLVYEGGKIIEGSNGKRLLFNRL